MKEICNGRINEGGICTRCYELAQTTSGYCTRLIGVEPAGQAGEEVFESFIRSMHLSRKWEKFYEEWQTISSESKQNKEWNTNKVIDFVNWYLRLCKVITDSNCRFELENMEVIDSFLRGDDYKLWWGKLGKESTFESKEVKECKTCIHNYEQQGVRCIWECDDNFSDYEKYPDIPSGSKEKIPVYDKKYLDECIKKATPGLSKIKDVDKTLDDIRGGGHSEKPEVSVENCAIECNGPDCEGCGDFKPKEQSAEEVLAPIAHGQWSGWMKYLFSKGEFKDGLWIMPQWAVERWTKQMNTDYSNLSKEEQESDKVEARKFIKAMEQYHNSRSINTNYLVEILKRTFKGNSDVKVEFGNESDNINFILDVCNNFKLELEKDKDCFQQGIEDLCQEVLRKGVPLPIYDYNYKKFISSYPANININNQISGIEKSEMFDTFRDACLWIINND